MRIKAFILVFVFALTSCSNNSISIPVLKFDGLRGNVSMIRESKFDAVEKFGEVVPDDLNEVIIYEYDNDGNPIKYGVYDDEGDYIFKLEQKYENGLLVSQTSSQKYGNKTVHNVVAERKKNYIKWLNNEGREDESSSELFYNGLSYKAVDKDGNTLTEVKCDKRGRLIEQKSYSDGQIIYRILRDYDKDGNLTASKEYYSPNEPTIMKYTYPEFDKKGNWVTQYTWKDGEVVGITKRDISYR